MYNDMFKVFLFIFLLFDFLIWDKYLIIEYLGYMFKGIVVFIYY